MKKIDKNQEKLNLKNWFFNHMSIHIYSQRNKAILFDPTKSEINNVDRISDSRLDNRKKTNLEII